MNRRGIFSIPVIAALGLAFLPTEALSEQKSLKEQIVGTWTFVSALDVKPDGTRSDRWGPNPKGIFIFDANGRFAQFITRSDIPKFAAKTADQGTLEENKAVLAGLVASFGTYTVNEADKMVITRVEGNIFPNLRSEERRRLIVSLTGDELKYTNPSTSTGTTAEATWRRVK